MTGERRYAAHIRGAAHQFYEQAPAHVQRYVDRVVGELELDPYLDGITKFPYSRPPLELNAYADELINILYQPVEYLRDPPLGFVLVVHAIGYADSMSDSDFSLVWV